jgi:hypothetical protein
MKKNKSVSKDSSHISIKKIIKEELKPILKRLDKIDKDLKEKKRTLRKIKFTQL